MKFFKKKLFTKRFEKDFSLFTLHSSLKQINPLPSPPPREGTKPVIQSEAKNLIQREGILACMLKNVRRCAFTLAEVLITLGIIGVVAALTMPTLIQNHQKQVYVTGLKKAYSNIQNAFSKMAFDEGVTDWNDLYCAAEKLSPSSYTHDECLAEIIKQFNVVEKKREDEICSADWCSYWDSLIFPYNSDYEGLGSVFVTTDGVTYLFPCYSFGDSLYIDINGSKGPNKFGRDIFAFEADFNKNKVVPVGIGREDDCTTDAVNNNSYGAQYCAARVLIEGKMDY